MAENITRRRRNYDINKILDFVTNDSDSDLVVDLGESDFENNELDADTIEYESEEPNIAMTTRMTTDSQIGYLVDG